MLLRFAVFAMALSTLTGIASANAQDFLWIANGKIGNFHFNGHNAHDQGGTWVCTGRALAEGGFLVEPNGLRTRAFQDTAHARAWLQHSCRRRGFLPIPELVFPVSPPIS